MIIYVCDRCQAEHKSAGEPVEGWEAGLCDKCYPKLKEVEAALQSYKQQVLKAFSQRERQPEAPRFW